MLLSIVSWLVGAACVTVSARRVMRVRELERESRPMSGLERASRERLLKGLPDSIAMGRVLRESLEAPTRAAAIASLNEALGDVDTELDVGRELPKSAGRIALAAGGFFGLIELARNLPEAGVNAVLPAVVTFAGGAIGALMCATLTRTSTVAARATRERWNALSQAVERLFPSYKSADLERVDRPEPAE